MLLGAIADDLTGATDLCLMLSREGMRTVQVIGIPGAGFDFGDAEAVVVALKSRTTPAQEAVAQSTAAARVLLESGAKQIIFKYCSTFDSTPRGNIGPVIEALMELMDVPLTIACPAFPANGRTVYQGHLYVGNTLLSESPMKDHPLTPMRDSNLVRVLQEQTRLPVGLLDYRTVAGGAEAMREAFARATKDGTRILIADAIDDSHLRALGAAAAGMRLITGGSGIAIGLPANFERAGGTVSSGFSAPRGRAVILAGSCSAATRRQIAGAIAAGVPSLKIDPIAVANGRVTPSDVIAFARNSRHPTPLAYSSDDPEEVRRAQETLGREQAGEIVERFLADVATGLRDHGFSRFIVAGGETSGAVVNALGVRALQIGPEIDPGVPWTLSLGSEPPLALALKSGNFGADDFLLKAWRLLQ